MTGLLQNLARLGRGEPIPGAARVALPPRFATARTDDDPVRETWSDEAQSLPSPPDAMPRRAIIMDDPPTETRQPHRAQTDTDEGGSRLPPVVKIDTETRPIHSDAAPPGPSAETGPRPPPRVTQPRETIVRDAPQHRHETPPPSTVPPLGHAVLADQSQRRRETPPVIKVTIDRIDIRSPEPPRAARTAKPAPKPSVSLSDYLHRPTPGGRA